MREGSTINRDALPGADENIDTQGGVGRCAPVRLPGQEALMSFRHAALIQDLDSAKAVSKNALIQTLHYTHFRGDKIFLHVRHPRRGDEFLLSALPEVCSDECLPCRLSSSDYEHLQRSDFLNLFVPIKDEVLLVPAALQAMAPFRAVFELPETGYVLNRRSLRRYPCRKTAAEIFQNAFVTRGKLLDFSPGGFRVQAALEDATAMQWFNPQALLTVCLRSRGSNLFSAPCRCIRHEESVSGATFVLAPEMPELHQFQQRTLRNPRQRMVPSFGLFFRHPFSGEEVQREVFDISNSGLAVLEQRSESTLMPGMVLSHCQITYAGAVNLKGVTLQVLYRKDHDDTHVRCGLAFMDMDIQTYTDLTNILISTLDPHMRISCKVSQEELWQFFFDTGFIYPDKYRLIESQSKPFKETCRKIYDAQPEIARHFTYQKNGHIFGHVSMVRVFDRTWMVHHLASKPVEKHLSGISVLRQINLFLKDLYRLPSAKMEYLMLYFQPQNRFSDLLFGGFGRMCQDPGSASMDLYDYFLHPRKAQPPEPLPRGWVLEEFSNHAWEEFQRCYRHVSGGLLPKILPFGRTAPGGEEIEAVYARHGLIRRCRFFSLWHHQDLCAVLIVNQTDPGLNFANLLNAISILVFDEERVSTEIFAWAVDSLGHFFDGSHIPVLAFPSGGPAQQNEVFQKSKKYVMCILDARLLNEFVEFSKRKLKISFFEST